jgi:NTP pyrophosphatase (non-canonical NTP hydrolase)
MTFKQFQQDALRTESVIEKAVVNPALFGEIINLALISTELMDVMKKNIYYGREIDRPLVATRLREAQEVVGVLLYGREASSEELKTELPESVDLRIMHAIIGKFTESGELLEALAKSMDGAPLDLVNIGEELGDDKWYDAILVDAAGFDMDVIQNTVIAKLKKRYPEKFTQEASENRDLAGERAVLEAGLSDDPAAVLDTREPVSV